MNVQTSVKHKHAVFLGSSKESEWLAKQIEGALFRGYSDFLEVSAWYHFGSWPAGASTLETLEQRLEEIDFAVLVLSEDDWTQSRDDPSRPAPRDNVVFELGLFMGRLGRRRAFFWFPSSRDFKLPSDLFGITALPYAIPDRAKAQSVVSPLCTQMVEQIRQVVSQERNRDMQLRPRLELSARFPRENGSTVSNLPRLSAAMVSILKVRASIDDDEIDEFLIYFDDDLHLQKSGWIYRLDETGQRGRCFWAASPQLRDMKSGGGGFLTFEICNPKKGAHHLEVVARKQGQESYNKKFTIHAD